MGKYLRVLATHYFFSGSLDTGFDALADLPSSLVGFSEMFAFINYHLVDENKLLY